MSYDDRTLPPLAFPPQGYPPQVEYANPPPLGYPPPKDAPPPESVCAPSQQEKGGIGDYFRCCVKEVLCCICTGMCSDQ